MGHWIPGAWGKSDESQQGGPSLTDFRHLIKQLLDIRGERGHSNAPVSRGCSNIHVPFFHLRVCSCFSIKWGMWNLRHGLENLWYALEDLRSCSTGVYGKQCRVIIGQCKASAKQVTEIWARNRFSVRLSHKRIDVKLKLWILIMLYKFILCSK